MTGSYRVEAVTIVRSVTMGSASPGMVAGLLWGIADALEQHPDALQTLSIEYQPDVPATPLGGRAEVER